MVQRVDIVRVYDDAGRRVDEYRVLADRLWSRGQCKDAVERCYRRDFLTPAGV